MYDSWDVVALVFFGTILAFYVAWRLLAAWARWYLRGRQRALRRVNRIDRSCERAGSQGEFHRRLQAGDWK